MVACGDWNFHFGFIFTELKFYLSYSSANSRTRPLLMQHTYMTGYHILQVEDYSAWTSPHMTNTWVTANRMPLMAQNMPDSEKRLGSLRWQKLPLPKFVFLSKQNTLPCYAAHQYSERRVVVVYLLSFTHSWSCREHHCTSAPHHPIVSSNCSQNNQLKVYLRRELSIFYLCHANREGGERTRAVKTWEYGDNLPASLLPRAEAVACCSSNDRRLSPWRAASFSLQSSISSLYYQSCHSWAMAS